MVHCSVGIANKLKKLTYPSDLSIALQPLRPSVLTPGMLSLETRSRLETVSRPDFEVLVLVLVLPADVLVLVLVLRDQVLVLVLVLRVQVLVFFLVLRG